MTLNNSNTTTVPARSCDEQDLTNATGTVVLCSAPWEASSKPPPQGFIDAVTRVAKAGAKGLIFAQHNSDIIEYTDIYCQAMACVLVDFEIARGIASYASSVK